MGNQVFEICSEIEKITLSLDNVIFFVFIIKICSYFFNVVFIAGWNFSVFKVVLIVEVFIYWIFTIH